MASTTTDKTITLKSNDGKEFVVSEMVAIQSRTFRHMIEDGWGQHTILLPNVSATILDKVIKYCKQQVDAADASNNNETTDEGSSTKMSDKEMEKWEQEFLDVDLDTLFDLVMAANYLDISKLLDAVCTKVAGMIKGKNLEGIRQTLNITNDFSAAEEEEIFRENQWARF